MAKDKKGSGIQQAAGLIRYFDEESEDAIQISKGLVYTVCVVFSLAIYLQQHGVWSWMGDVLSGIV
ncbi:MAG: preprotein translocase subunit Sec61beta [Euryarchaeota archaeon]|jgi:preprotein translocase subunit Sec61beta|nr:preprotein translocase subunit Sec61beta [Euryarchaeota archaeon]MDC0041074.1 hypothetical protein [Candidatus Poseidoniales archaeon]MDC0151728.1 preprotein translocase subunit Sec61beta [bacterium]MDG1536295.1 hypothetical protein [Candidatus Thalassarchaeaceae archaeon]MDC0149749.1 hypothetical protein [Candidatus Poseidoniales archaeon]|tara:strand:- start:346 stop:543 length:198 start_codon:yes stop_codon:yes gene_type:complete